MASKHLATDAPPGPPLTGLPASPNSISSSVPPNSSGGGSPTFLKTAAKPDQAAKLPSLTSIASAGLSASPMPKSPNDMRALSPGRSPTPLTAAAAAADERRARQERERAESRKQSQNPATTALGALLGQTLGISRPQDAPRATTAMSDALAVAANAISAPERIQVDGNAQTSPVSVSSMASFNSAAPPTTLKTSSEDSSTTTGPALEAEKEARLPRAGDKRPTPDDGAAPDERPSNRAFTFPGPLQATQDDEAAHTPLRGMSMPMAGTGPGPARSPSSRKHKCPYCATDFTRHHNLKSHLLTHSHEKPFVCSTCQARFRRLHDLKRHSKLHTGERPHICPKCGRRFARGDALARHNKGHGGCAGRRASMGSFGGDEEYEEGYDRHDDSLPGSGGREDGMDDLIYTGDASNAADRMDEDGGAGEGRRRLSLPTIRAPDAAGEPQQGAPPAGQAAYPTSSPPPPPQPPQAQAQQQQHHHQHQQQQQHQQQKHQQKKLPSTYPPATRPGAGTGAGAGALHAPQGRADASNKAASPGTQTRGFSPPKPYGAGAGSTALHPAGPSLFAQGGMTESPKPLSPGAQHPGHPELHMRANRASSLTEQFQQQQYGRRGSGRSPPPMGLPPLSAGSHAPYLPSLPGLAPSESRYPPLGGSQSGSAGHHQPGGAAGDSTSTHGQGSGDGSGNVTGGSVDGLWAYVRSLEERLGHLTEEVASLRKHCPGQQAPKQAGSA
ncbi:MAG: hypothetical protein M1832_004065 [Thelocarpon impressellum]|nr:MAG: hypothetical protein M1832_004065 [Thelocarpon impressellum]